MSCGSLTYNETLQKVQKWLLHVSPLVATTWGDEMVWSSPSIYIVELLHHQNPFSQITEPHECSGALRGVLLQ